MDVPVPPDNQIEAEFSSRLTDHLILCDSVDGLIKLYSCVCEPEGIEMIKIYPHFALILRDKLVEVINKVEEEDKYTFVVFYSKLFENMPWFVQKILYQNEGDTAGHLSPLFLLFIQEERTKVLCRLDDVLEIEEVEILNLIAQFAV